MLYEYDKQFLTNPLNGDRVSLSNMDAHMLSKGLVPVFDSNDSITWFSRSSYEKLVKKRRISRIISGSCLVLFLAFLSGGIVFLLKQNQEPIDTKPHPNKISILDTIHHKILITDIETNEERLLKYTTMDSLGLKIKDSLKYTLVGDTIEFFSPNYSNRLCFNINNDNVLRFNRKNIIARKNAEILKQNIDTINQNQY